MDLGWLKQANTVLGAIVESNNEQPSAKGNQADQSVTVTTGKAPDGSNLTQSKPAAGLLSNPYVLWGGVGAGVLVLVLIVVVALKK